jgi:FMN phosphatase YigB (HAD superfamily)
MNKIIFFDIDDVLFKTNVFIVSGLKEYTCYEDAKKSIIEIKKIATLGILSKGKLDFQLAKLEKTGLIKFFKKEDIYIVPAKDKSVNKIFSKYKDREIFVIDDRIDNLNRLKRVNQNIKTIFIKRGRYKYFQYGNKFDFKIKDLKQLVKTI